MSSLKNSFNVVCEIANKDMEFACNFIGWLEYQKLEAIRMAGKSKYNKLMSPG
jgi:hypothetical protein